MLVYPLIRALAEKGENRIYEAQSPARFSSPFAPFPPRGFVWARGLENSFPKHALDARRRQKHYPFLITTLYHFQGEGHISRYPPTMMARRFHAR